VTGGTRLARIVARVWRNPRSQAIPNALRAVLKTASAVTGARGFKSHPRRLNSRALETVAALEKEIYEGEEEWIGRAA
jgi:hypothetical protein